MRLNVLSNGLPQKCFYSPDIDLKEQNISFTVSWMPSANTNTCSFDAQNRQDWFTDMVCDWAKVSDLSVTAGVFKPAVQTKNMTLASTIALDGVPIYSGTSMTLGVDPYYPTKYKADSIPNVEKVDSCLGRTDSDGTYYYRTGSPCLQATYSPAVGSECSQCLKNMKGYY